MSAQGSGQAPRRRLRGADRKREILAAARKAFSAQGYAGASVAEIAAAVGVVEGAVYRHFPTKRQLLFEAAEAFYRPVIEETRAQLQVLQGTRQRLRHLILRHLKAFAEEPGFCRLIIQDIRPHPDYPNSVVYALNREATSLLLGILQEGIESGEFRLDLPAGMVRDVIFGGIEHVMWKALSGRKAPDVERIADDLTELLLHGVSAPDTALDGAPDPLEKRLGRIERKLDTLNRTGGRSRSRRQVASPAKEKKQ